MSRAAIVTGGGSGIGRAVALALADAGWRVAIAGRRESALATVCAERPGLYAVIADVRDEHSVRQLFDQAAARFGRIDLLFNNAGNGRGAHRPAGCQRRRLVPR